MDQTNPGSFFCPYCKEKLSVPVWREHIRQNVCGKVPVETLGSFLAH